MTPTLISDLDRLKKIRSFVLATVKDLSTAQLNHIPEGYNNNIIWNMAHLIAAQEGVCYLRAGLPTNIPDTFYQDYKPGSKPTVDHSDAEIEAIKTLLANSFEPLVNDLKQNKFVNYSPWKTRYDVEMNDIAGAVSFLAFHEGMHLGYIMALKRLL